MAIGDIEKKIIADAKNLTGEAKAELLKAISWLETNKYVWMAGCVIVGMIAGYVLHSL